MTVATQFKATFDERQGKAFSDYVRRFEITPADLVAGCYYVPVEPGEIVLEVRAKVATAFDNAATLTVGDGSDADGFLKVGDLDPTSLNAFVRSSGKGASADVTTNGDAAYEWAPNAFAAGKHFATVGVVKATFTGTPTVGKLILSVVYDGYGAGPDTRSEVTNYS